MKKPFRASVSDNKSQTLIEFTTTPPYSVTDRNVEEFIRTLMGTNVLSLPIQATLTPNYHVLLVVPAEVSVAATRRTLAAHAEDRNLEIAWGTMSEDDYAALLPLVVQRQMALGSSRKRWLD